MVASMSSTSDFCLWMDLTYFSSPLLWGTSFEQGEGKHTLKGSRVSLERRR